MSLPERWNWGGCLYPNPSRCAAPVGRGQRDNEYGGTTVESRADRTVSGLMSLLACATGFPSSLGKRTILCLISASFTINGDAGTETRSPRGSWAYITANGRQSIWFTSAHIVLNPVAHRFWRLPHPYTRARRSSLAGRRTPAVPSAG